MNKYYYVPVTSRHIMFDNKSLLDVTGVINPLLRNRELGRVEIMNRDKTDSSSLEMKKVLAHYNSETSLIYKNSGIPERLILVQNCNGLKELLTQNDVSVMENYLHCFEIDACEVDYILESTDYFNESYNYFCLYKFRNKNVKSNIKK